MCAAGWRVCPPRLPDQPIFYPVLNEAYAVKIARDRNVPAPGAGYVTRLRSTQTSRAVIRCARRADDPGAAGSGRGVGGLQRSSGRSDPRCPRVPRSRLPAYRTPTREMALRLGQLIDTAEVLIGAQHAHQLRWTLDIN